MDHPLLTEVVDRGLRHGDHDTMHRRSAETLVSRIPPAIADRLEAALDVCQRMGDFDSVCGLPEDHPCHVHESWSCTYPDGHGPDMSCHPYVPLVQS